jgi:NDP-sugar pyrophosphorylase family protein
MKAVILAGGYSTRLRPISYVIPKLLFPVVGKPMIYWILDLLKNFGVDEVVLGVNYLANALQKTVGSSYKNIRVTYSLEDEPLGTAGALRLAAKTIGLNKTFLALNGDVIAQINLSTMLNEHQRANALLTDALCQVKNPSRFGVAELNSNKRIKRFVEKPRPRETSSNLVNAGIYLVEPKVLDMIPIGQRVSLEKQVFPVLAKSHRLTGFPFEGFWFDIGNFEDYRRANFTLLQCDIRKRTADKHTITRKGFKNIDPIYLGKGSRVEKNAVLGPCALVGKNCVMEKGSRVSQSVLFDDVIVGERSSILGAVVASNVKLGKRVVINPGCILSPNLTIGDDVKVGRGVIIHPYKEITTHLKAGTHIL